MLPIFINSPYLWLKLLSLQAITSPWKLLALLKLEFPQWQMQDVFEFVTFTHMHSMVVVTLDAWQCHSQWTISTWFETKEYIN
jgi:hypothetical protein